MECTGVQGGHPDRKGKVLRPCDLKPQTGNREKEVVFSRGRGPETETGKGEEY